MIDRKIQNKVENATVTLLGKKGQGVLVKNNLILTAAHCIEFTMSGEMVFDNFLIEEIETVRGKINVSPWAVEPVSDIAVLGSVDGQVNKDFYDEAIAFEEFCDTTKAIPLCLQTFKQFESFPIYIYTHKKTWIKGEAIQCSPEKYYPTIHVKTEHPIEGGTSGGPIINEQGQLVAIVSNSSSGKVNNDNFEGSQPFLHLALPVWVKKRISQR